MRLDPIWQCVISSLLLLCIGAACTSISSKNVKTAGITAHMSVIADDTGATKAGAEYNVGESVVDFVALSSGETAVAKVGSLSQTMTQAQLLGITAYNTTFTGQGAGGTVYTIALNRTADEASAPSSTCTLPEPFSITAPANQLTFSRASDDIVVTYSGSGQTDPMTWSVDVSCVNGTGQSLSGDTGSFTIPKGTLVAKTTGNTCSVTLTLTRSRAGTVDPAFQGGDMSGQQTRVLTFTSKP